MQDNGNTTLYYLGILIVFCGILFLAWLTTKFIGKKVSGERRNKSMRIVETLSLGVDRNLLLVQVGEKFYLLASSRGRTDFMSEVNPGDISKDEVKASDFQNIFSRYSGLGEKPGNRTSGFPAEKNAEAETPTDIQSGIRRMRHINRHDEP